MPAAEDYLLLLPNRFRQSQFLHRIAMIVFAFTIVLCIFFFVSFYLNNSKLTKPSILPHRACKVVKYDYNLLALSWSPTFCALQKCINNAEDWTIHGLWPSSLKGPDPEKCCPQWVFSSETITSLLPSLEEKWPNRLPGKSKNSLWQHEWSKHGTCSSFARDGGIMEYFNATISLYNTYPIKSYFEEASITPTGKDGPFYTLQQIHSAIESKINKTIAVKCTESPEKKSTQLLDTIYLCFSPDNLTLIDCPTKDRCRGKNVIYPHIINSPSIKRKNQPE